MSILQTIDLKKYYGTEPNITKALDGVNFSVEEGEFVAVVGTSGSGKSTMLHMMGGLDTPTSGRVIVRGEELAKKNDEELTIFRRRNIGFIFQNYNLVPILNVYENIVLPVELDGDTVDQGFMDEVVHMLALEDKLKNMPNNLSGGQQQRVAIARALVAKPAIVLADEPTGNLDSKTSADVMGLIKRTSYEFHQTVVMITHNNEIARLADRIVRIEDGKIVPASDPVITCQCIRVPVLNGHTAAVFVKFRKNPTKEQLIKALVEFKGLPQELELPSAPKQFIQYLEEDNRPQVTEDVNFEHGMGVSVGRLREDTVYDWKFVGLSHNTVRGAAGGAVLCAETLKAKGYIQAK